MGLGSIRMGGFGQANGFRLILPPLVLMGYLGLFFYIYILFGIIMMCIYNVMCNFFK